MADTPKLSPRFICHDHNASKFVVDQNGEARKANGSPIALPDLSHWDFYERNLISWVTQVRGNDGFGNRVQFCATEDNDPQLLAWLHDILVEFENSGIRSEEPIYR